MEVDDEQKREFRQEMRAAYAEIARESAEHVVERYKFLGREGWQPPHGTRQYTCGWCGAAPSTFIGLIHHARHEPPSKITLALSGARAAPPVADVRVCSVCLLATTFTADGQQHPPPLRGEAFDASKMNQDVQMIVALYDEARNALSRGAPSCAVLMLRKILMHIAAEQGAKPGLKFIEYVAFMQQNNVVGKPQHPLLDRIRQDGKLEAHEVCRASQAQAADLLTLATLLVRSVYFAA